MSKEKKFTFAPKNISLLALFLGFLFCISPWASGASALAFGVFVACVLGNPFVDKTKIYSQKLLSYSIIGLGAGMNLMTVGQAGLTGLGFTFVSIFLTLLLGIALGKLLKTEVETSILTSVGTAICGGSAIAAVAPVIKAKSQSITVALGTVFFLNAAALILFPIIGHYLDLSQHQFGLWSALAIHDTSSVVGAGLQYGAEALQTGTTVKLARALWIVPVTLAMSFFYQKKNQVDGNKIKKPWFIIGFLLMSALVTWIPQVHNLGHTIEFVARKGLIITLFLIGANLTRATIKAVGMRPFIQGFILWVIVSVSSLMTIYIFV